MIACWSSNTPIGILYICEDNGFITQIGTTRPTCSMVSSPLLLKAQRQIEEYFVHKRKVFDLPLNPLGTEFQTKVWQELCLIPYGETRTYGQIATAVGNVKASRAVGMANHKNPIMLVIPCHRVIGANGSLTGYAGGLDIKQGLLTHEKE